MIKSLIILFLFFYTSLISARGICDRSDDIRKNLQKWVGRRDCSKISMDDLKLVKNFYIIYGHDEYRHDNTPLRRIKSGDLRGLVNIKTLVIQNSKIKRIDKEMFRDLKSLTTLDLSHNKIEKLEEGVFQYLTKLKSLELDDNPLEYPIPVGMLKGLSRLYQLDIDTTNIKTLPRGLFKDTPRLRHIDLKYNWIKYLHPKVFEDLKKLKKIKVYGNSFQFNKRTPGYKKFPWRKLSYKK